MRRAWNHALEVRPVRVVVGASFFFGVFGLKARASRRWGVLFFFGVFGFGPWPSRSQPVQWEPYFRADGRRPRCHTILASERRRDPTHSTAIRGSGEAYNDRCAHAAGWPHSLAAIRSLAPTQRSKHAFATQVSVHQNERGKTRMETAVDASEVAELERLLARLRSKAQAVAARPITLRAASSSEDASHAEDSSSEPSAKERGSAGQASAVRSRARKKNIRTDVGTGGAPGVRGGRTSRRSAKVLWDTSSGKADDSPLLFAQQPNRSELMAEMLERYARLREQAAELPSPGSKSPAPTESARAPSSLP
jgi:hypothetical protein